MIALRSVHAGRPRDGLFRSFPGGLGELVAALVASLPPDTLQLSASVRSVERSPSGRYRVVLHTGHSADFDSVIVAVPAFVVAQILAPVDTRLAALAGEVRYASSASVALGYRREAVAHPLNGSGFVVPLVEHDVRLTAASWMSSKWAGRAPAGTVLLRAFLGGARHADLLDQNDEGLQRLAHSELSRLLGITGDPILARLHRWTRANAQHEVGHLARMAEIERRTSELAGLFVTGSGFRGTGITDCIADGRRVAMQAATYLRSSAAMGRASDPSR
jgi:oxygen-dependent protoporphyrinogen oxidase